MHTIVLLPFAVLLSMQVPKEPAKDLGMHSAKVPGVEVRYVDYHWQPAIFEAMASGKGDIPAAKDNWVLARFVFPDQPLTLEGKRLRAGNYGLGLWPNLDGKGMMIEMRRVDMRDLYPSPNAMAPLPPGETMYKGPARFETASPLAERLDVKLSEASGGMVILTVRYGDRRLVLNFTR
jgi:hypothetical protein